VRLCVHIHTNLYIHTHTHTCARAHPFSLSNTHTHTHTHTHIQGQSQKAAQVMQQQDVVMVSALMPQNLSAEYTVAPVFEQAPRASSAVMSGLIVPAPRITMPPQNYTPSLAPSLIQQPPVGATSLQSRIVFKGYPS
jgi:succinylglutamate desuccinylase